MFSGKTVIVTGSGRGIGRAVALKFGSLGANVIVNYAASSNKAQEVVNEIIEVGGHAIAIKADIRNSNEVEEMFTKTMDTYGSVDILVNNAGITKDALIIRMNDEDFDDVIDINLKGAFKCTKAASKIMMKQRSGTIINISSVIGLIGNGGQANYASSKAGIIGLTKSAARELAPRGINVNAIAPGFIKSDMTDVLTDKIKDSILKQIPLGTFGECEDVANLIVFLSSKNARYITGQIINVDGGMVM